MGKRLKTVSVEKSVAGGNLCHGANSRRASTRVQMVELTSAALQGQVDGDPHLPEFERRSFALTQPEHQSSRMNEWLDMIVRKPCGEDQAFVPVGVVSKDYTLVQHTSIFDQAVTALEQQRIPMDEAECRLTLTQYGERMSLRIRFPSSFEIEFGDGHPMTLRLECFNSVDGSTRFHAHVGWFRLVCSNGLVIGVTSANLRRRHSGEIELEDLQRVLTSGIQESKTDRINFERWRKMLIQPIQLQNWADHDLRKAWGFRAATRVLHISRTGHDVEIIGPYKDKSPSTIPVRKGQKIPGAPAVSVSLFDISQNLAWLARDRRDVQEQLEWKQSIPQLMKVLLI